MCAAEFAQVCRVVIFVTFHVGGSAERQAICSVLLIDMLKSVIGECGDSTCQILAYNEAEGSKSRNEIQR